MQKTILKEKVLHPVNGILAIFLILVFTALSVASIVFGVLRAEDGQSATGIPFIVLGIIGVCVFPVLSAGVKLLQPNEARVLTLFGKYYGTIVSPGCFFVNPFCVSVCPVTPPPEPEMNANGVLSSAQKSVNLSILKKTISLKTQTLDNDRQKVNDVLGNPIIIGAVVIWHVSDPTQAVFSVENYKEYLSIQTDSIIRNTARLYPYDVFDDNEDDDGIKERSLRGSALEIADVMKGELQKKVAESGLEIEEVRITHLAYSEEIAAAMLQRQQASAIIAARQKIVDGAVGMVKMAIDKLNEDEIVLLDEERKAAMVSNLLVVLCGNKDAQPIVNSGSIY